MDCEGQCTAIRSDGLIGFSCSSVASGATSIYQVLIPGQARVSMLLVDRESQSGQLSHATGQKLLNLG